MKKRLVITTVVAFFLLVAILAAALNTIFTVTHVRTDFSTYSEAGKEEAATLREELDAYIGKSTTFLDLEEVASTVEKYPYFHLEKIEKQYPTTIYLRILERKETFSVAEQGGGYADYADNGVFLRTAETCENRAGGDNILLTGFAFTRSGEPAVFKGTYAEEVRLAAEAFRERLGEVRANIVSIELVRKTSDARNDFFRIHTREGVVIDLGNPASLAADKARLAVERYLSLGDEDRIFGYITVLDGNDGKLYSDYTRNSAL